MFGIMETYGLRGRSEPVATFESLDAAMNAANERFSIALMERDSDGYEAADFMTKDGRLFLIEKIGDPFFKAA